MNLARGVATGAERAFVALGLAGLAGLAGCGGGGDATAPATITVTREQPSVATDVSGAATPSPAASVSVAPTAPPAMNRAFDAALVTSSRMQGEQLVLVIDRLTVAGVDDTTLASSGVPVAPDPGDRFGNQRQALYEVGVADSAVFVLTSCTRGPDGVQQTSQPLGADDFVSSVPADAPVIIAYTNGLVSRAEVNPRC